MYKNVSIYHCLADSLYRAIDCEYNSPLYVWSCLRLVPYMCCQYELCERKHEKKQMFCANNPVFFLPSASEVSPAGFLR